MSAEGYQVERTMAVLDQWMDDAAEGGGMGAMPEPGELDPVAAGLIRAGPSGDKFTIDRILTRAFAADLDGLFFAFMVANLAGRILAQAGGSQAQAVALVDGWINELVRGRARAAASHLDLGSVVGFCLPLGLGLALGFALDARRVFAAGLPFGLLGRDVLCVLVDLRKQLVQPRRRVIVPRRGLTFRACLRSGPGIRPERGWRVWLGWMLWRPGLPGVDGGLVLAGDGVMFRGPVTGLLVPDTASTCAAQDSHPASVR